MEIVPGLSATLMGRELNSLLVRFDLDILNKTFTRLLDLCHRESMILRER